MLHIFGSTVKKRTVISLAVLYIVLLMIVIIAGKIKKMKLSSENISASTTGSDEATELSAQAVQTSTRRSTCAKCPPPAATGRTATGSRSRL